MRLLALIGAIAIVVGIAALVFFFGGFFNVAATNPEPAPVSWALIKVRTASVDRNATQMPPAGYDTPEKVQAGAKAYLLKGMTVEELLSTILAVHSIGLLFPIRWLLCSTRRCSHLNLTTSNPIFNAFSCQY